MVQIVPPFTCPDMTEFQLTLNVKNIEKTVLDEITDLIHLL